MASTNHSLAQNTTASAPAPLPSPSSSPIKSDSIAIAKKEHGFLGIFKRMFGKYKFKTPKDTGAVSKKSKRNDTTKVAIKLPHPAVFGLTHGGITYTSLYTQGVNLGTGISGLYNMAHAYQDFNMEGIPLVAEATGVINNGQFMKEYSSYSVNFDSRTFISALEKRARDLALNKLATEKSHLPNGQHMNLTDSLNEFESVRSKLTSPSYQTEITIAQQRLKKIEDSLAQTEEKRVKDSAAKDSKNEIKAKDTLVKVPKQDSLMKTPNGKQDSLAKKPKVDTAELHSLRQKITLYEKLEKRYEQLYQIKRNYNKLTRVDSAEKSLDGKYEKDKSLLSNPDNIKKLLLANKMLSPYEKFFMGFQYITIGRSSQEMSEFTLHNFMMTGINIGYKTGDMYAAGGYGNEVAVINPYLMTSINVPTYHRTIEYASAGIGSPKESNLYITAINISDPGTSYSLAENNWILDVSKKITFGKSFDITGEMAHSYFNYLPNSKLDSLAPSNLTNGSDMAFALKAHGIIPVFNTDIKVEYLNTGDNYITLGNQFLLSGTKTYRVMLKQRVSKKLSLELGGAHILQDQNNLTGTQQTDNWIAFGFKYKPTNYWDIGADYSPRQLQQVQGTVIANSLTSNINQLSFTSNLKAELFDKDILTSIFVGNFQYNTPETTSFLNQNINLSYYMLNEMIMLTSYSSINLTGNESRSGWTGNISQFIGEGVYNMAIGKSFMFSSGLQMIEQSGVISNGAGLIGSIGKMFGKWGKLSIQMNCRNNIDDIFDFKTGQILISTNVSIIW